MTSKTKTKISVIAASSMMASLMCISLMLQGMSKAFPNASDVQIQQTYTIAYAANTVATLLAGILAKLITKKKIIFVSCILGGWAGILGLVATGTLTSIYIAGILAGLAAGAISVVTAVIAENFESSERAGVIGLQSFALNIVSTLMGVACGYLAAVRWNLPMAMFLLFFVIAIPIGLFMPTGRVERLTKEEKESGVKSKLLTPAYIKIILCFFLYGAVNLTMSMNITFVARDSIVSGYASSVYTIAGCLIGLVAGPVYKVLQKKTLFVGMGLVSASYALFSLLPGTGLIMVASVLYGIGYSLSAIALNTMVAETVSPDNLTLGYQIYSTLGMLGMSLHVRLVTIPAALFSASISVRYIWSIILIAIVFLVLLIPERSGSALQTEAEPKASTEDDP